MLPIQQTENMQVFVDTIGGIKESILHKQPQHGSNDVLIAFQHQKDGKVPYLNCVDLCFAMITIFKLYLSA